MKKELGSREKDKRLAQNAPGKKENAELQRGKKRVKTKENTQQDTAAPSAISWYLYTCRYGVNSTLVRENGPG